MSAAPLDRHLGSELTLLRGMLPNRMREAEPLRGDTRLGPSASFMQNDLAKTGTSHVPVQSPSHELEAELFRMALSVCAPWVLPPLVLPLPPPPSAALRTPHTTATPALPPTWSLVHAAPWSGGFGSPPTISLPRRPQTPALCSHNTL